MTPRPEPLRKNYKTHRFQPLTSMAFEDYMRGLERREFVTTKRIRRITPDEAMRKLLEHPEVKEIRAEAHKPPDRL